MDAPRHPGHYSSDAAGGAQAALASTEGPWSALSGLLWTLAERQAADDVLGEAMATVAEHPSVAA
jgi:hypothetical protein